MSGKVNDPCTSGNPASDKSQVSSSSTGRSQKKTGLLGEKASSASNNITDRIRKLFSTELYSDVEFVLRGSKDSTKAVFPAHRNILAVGSPVFADMLYSDALNSLQCFPISVQIENLSYETFGNVIEFLYTDDVYLETLSEAIETLLAAKRFEVKALIKRCEEFLDKETLHAENVCTTLQEALQKQIDRLSERCMIFFQKYTREVIQSSDFLKISTSTLKKLCTASTLALKSEGELFGALMRWYQKQRSSKTVIWAPILQHIRFLSMSSTEFGNIIQRHPRFLNEKEALSILVHIVDRNSKQILPKWCNKESNRCYLLSPPPNNTQEPTTQEQSTPDACDPDTIFIALKSSNQKQKIITALSSVLEAKCRTGKYRLKTISMEFQEPVSANSCMEITILLTIKPSNFKFHKSFTIRNSKTISFDVDENILFGSNNILVMRINATNIKNYNFKKFDAENSFSQIDSPFVCAASSIPSDEKLFFIKGISFEHIRRSNYSREYRSVW